LRTLARPNAHIAAPSICSIEKKSNDHGSKILENLLKTVQLPFLALDIPWKWAGMKSIQVLVDSVENIDKKSIKMMKIEAK
jgi:hypothetical protein